MSVTGRGEIAAKNIVVTGGAGFIGSHIASRLVNDGFKVTVVDNLSTGRIENVPAGAAFIMADLGEEESIKFLGDVKCDALFHLAGQSSGEASFIDPYYDLKSHVMSTFWLLRWCIEKGVKRFMYSSSMSVYGDPDCLPVKENHPLNPRTYYGAAKAGAEAYINFFKSLGINTTIFRLFSVYGPGQNLQNRMQGMASIYLSYMLEGKPLTVKGSKDRFRDMVYIDDVVDAWIASIQNPSTSGNTYNLAGGRKTTVEELVCMLKKAFGDENYPVEYAPGTPGDQFGLTADISALVDDLKWRPKINMETGIRRMVEFEKRSVRS